MGLNEGHEAGAADTPASLRPLIVSARERILDHPEAPAPVIDGRERDVAAVGMQRNPHDLVLAPKAASTLFHGRQVTNGPYLCHGEFTMAGRRIG